MENKKIQIDWELSDDIFEDNGSRTIFKSVMGANILAQNQFFNFGEKKTSLGEPREIIFYLNEGDYLKDFIDKMPYGIINKNVTGIGATTLELEYSERNSIIVLPSKSLAYSKHLSVRDSLYVGSKMGDMTSSTTDESITNYINNPEIIYKKILVVADSLERVVKNIGKEGLAEYFIMVDEVDTLQSDSHFRPKLENVMDYYFNYFSRTQRCVVSATIRDFSHPELKNEMMFSIEQSQPNKRNINLIHTNNINKVLIDKITSIPSEKILIAYNTVRDARKIIGRLDESIRNECAIMCGEGSESIAGEYYTILGADNKLSKRINFMTCSYFSGVDIKDDYHLITVSNCHIAHQTLTLNRMTQIHGRCRKPNHLLSDTIIYNTRDYCDIENLLNYEKSLHSISEKVLTYLNGAEDVPIGNDYALPLMLHNIKSAIVDNTAEKFEGETNPIPLIRQTINKTYDKAYFNIDCLLEKKELTLGLYGFPHIMEKALKQNHNISLEKVYIKKEINERVDEDTVSGNLRDIKDLEIGEARNSINAHLEAGTLTPRVINTLKNSASANTRTFYEQFHILYKYCDTTSLLSILWEYRNQDRRKRVNIHNAILFGALADNHPFKRDILSEFSIGQFYTPNEIQEKLSPLFTQYLITSIDSRKAVAFLGSIFELTRRRVGGINKYRIERINPYNIQSYNQSLDRDIANLREYFKLN